MNGIVTWFTKNAVAANLIMLVAFIGGFIAFNSMERKMFPNAQLDTVFVGVNWPGASPQEVEEQIVTRIEEIVSDIDGIDRITSVANEGNASVYVVARQSTDMDRFVDEVKLRVDQINNLPRDSYQPNVSRRYARNWFMGLTVSGNMDRLTLKRIADKVRDDIAKIRGGELATVDGVLSEEVSIEVREDTLRRYGITLPEIAEAVSGSSLNRSAGSVRTESGTIGLAARSLADTASQFEDIIVRQSSAQGTIRVGDLAEVTDGFVDFDLFSSFNGQASAFIFLPSPEKMQIQEYTDAVKDYVERANDPANKIIPEAAQLNVLWDDSVPFEGRMRTIGYAAGLGSLLVLIVLILFLRPAVAFWVTIGIMTAFAGGIMLLPFFGVSFNVLSLFAVLLVIGVVVDDAIIVGENIHREVELGKHEGFDGAIIGTQMVLKPVMFGVLTTIIAFLPWAFVSGATRSFTQEISFVVVAALAFSLLEALFILPAHLRHLKKQEFKGTLGKFGRMQRKVADSLLWVAKNYYKPTLEAAIRFRYATILFFCSLLISGITLVTANYVPFRFMPEIEADLIQVDIQLPEGTPFSRTTQVREQLQNGIDTLQANSSDYFPSIDGSVIVNSSVVASTARVQAWIGITPPEERPKSISSRDITLELRELVGPVPDAEDISFEFTFNENSNGLAIALNSNSLDSLRNAADDLKKHLSTYGTTFDIRDNLNSAAAEVKISLKPGAKSLGITLSQVTQQVRAAFYGIEVQRLPRDGEDVRVMVRLSKNERRSLDTLRQIRIRTNDGREIPINSVAEFEYGPGVSRIIRRDRERSVTVRAELNDDTRNQIMKDLGENYWPNFSDRFPDVSQEKAGGARDESEFMQEIQILLLIAIGVMYILLAIAFGSYFQPLLIMTAIPFAYTGAVYGHLIAGIPIAMFSYFGIAAAAGVVINDNLVLIDFVNRRRAQGIGAVQSLVDAGLARFRPVLLTSVTTVVGILPLIAERSVQAQFLKPMVIALGSAVAFALFISLLMVPALYAVGVECGRYVRWMLHLDKKFKHIGETYQGDDLSGNDEVDALPAKA